MRILLIITVTFVLTACDVVGNYERERELSLRSAPVDLSELEVAAVLFVDQDGSLLIDRQPVSFADLSDELAKRITSPETQKVVMQAHPQSKTARIVEVREVVGSLIGRHHYIKLAEEPYFEE